MKDGRTVLLEHDSGWMIAVDKGSASPNYMVLNRNILRPKHNLPSHGVAYCSTLESALNRLFSKLIIEHVAKNKEYCASLQDLRKAIEDARNDFDQLLKPKKDK